MGTITELNVGGGGAGVSDYNDLTNKPTTTISPINILDSDNIIVHNIGITKGQTVVDVILYDGTENIPVSNWIIVDANTLVVPSTIAIANARIEIISK